MGAHRMQGHAAGPGASSWPEPGTSHPDGCSTERFVWVHLRACFACQVELTTSRTLRGRAAPWSGRAATCRMESSRPALGSTARSAGVGPTGAHAEPSSGCPMRPSARPPGVSSAGARPPTPGGAATRVRARGTGRHVSGIGSSRYLATASGNERSSDILHWNSCGKPTRLTRSRKRGSDCSQSKSLSRCIQVRAAARAS